MQYFEDIELNKVSKAPPYYISKEEIIEFASVWDPQPFHTDEEAAKKWPLGLSASSLHTMAISVRAFSTPDADMDEHPAAIAGMGWDEIRMPHPVRPGDTLTVQGFVGSKRESKSKPDMGIIVTHIEVYNQDEVLVLSYKIATMVLKESAKDKIPL